MINFVTAAGHSYTLKNLLPSLKSRTRIWYYETLIRKSKLPSGTWIFTDQERLSAFELSLAAAVAQQLGEAGCKVLNHPAEVKSRYNFLDALWKAGINDFRVFRADESPTPSRFPVFLRKDYDHRGDARALIHSQAELDAALADLQRKGVPLGGQLVIEFASEEASPGIWYRGSAYRINDTIIAHHMTLDDKWLVKDGFEAQQLNAYAFREEFLAREKAFVLNNEHAALFRQVFDIAGIQYGRADFGFAGGKVQIFEINTNPNHASQREIFKGIHPGREQTMRLAEQKVHGALDTIDTVSSAKVVTGGDLLAKQRRFFPILPMMLRRS